MKTFPCQSVLRMNGIFIPILIALSVVPYLQKSMHAASRTAVALDRLATARLSRPVSNPIDTAVSATGRNQSGSRPDSRDPALHGTLVISGGGDAPPAVISEFLAAAGGAHARLVVVPTASELAGTPELDEDLEDWRKQNVVACTVLHTTSRDVANDADFCRPLESATGVWFMGGSQSKLADVYLNTRFLTMVKAVLERDGVVGGESAGAAIMSSLMICGGYESPRTGRGFGLLPGTLIDQHFITRNRDGRMRQVLQFQPGLVGLGIDEETAIIVRNGQFTVAGNSRVVVYLSPIGGPVAIARTLAAGGQANLAALTAAAADSRQLAGTVR